MTMTIINEDEDEQISDGNDSERTMMISKKIQTAWMRKIIRCR